MSRFVVFADNVWVYQDFSAKFSLSTLLVWIPAFAGMTGGVICLNIVTCYSLLFHPDMSVSVNPGGLYMAWLVREFLDRITGLTGSINLPKAKW